MKKLLVFLYCCGAMNSIACVADASVLKNFLASQSVSGVFSQQTVDKQGKATEEPSQGDFKFQKPGKFNWVYQTPYEQVMVCDGKELFVWDKDLNQVTVSNAKGAIPQSPASILFGQDSLDRDWDITQLPDKDGLTLFKLVPKKKDASVKEVIFGFKGENPELLQVNGLMGEKTTLQFKDVKTNERIAPSVFSFVPPKGADVLKVK